MMPKDIVVGALYRHQEYPYVIYLGCGSFPYPSGKKRKFLIVLKNLLSGKYDGARVSFQNTKQSRDWWSKLHLSN
jgi:hypothetical protein